MSFFRNLFAGKQPESDDNFTALLAQSLAELQAKTAAHEGAWLIGEATWAVDQDDGLIVFTRPNGITASAPVQIIGTYNTEDATWLWGWEHPSVLPPLQGHAQHVRAYGEQHSIARLTTQKLSCTEQDAWELTALACKLNEAQGAYRGPAGTALVFMTFGEVTLRGEQAVASEPLDFADVTSCEQAEQLCETGVLTRLYLLSPAFGGAEIPVNTVYVTPQAAAAKARIDDTVRTMIQQGQSVGYSAEPQYNNDSIVPAQIVIEATGDTPLREEIAVW